MELGEVELNAKLYLVGTPIGNLEDMSYRAIRVLKEVNLIAAEDTRHTRKLLEYFEIRTPMTSFHEHNELEKSNELIKKILNGESIALVTDAGMPGISDPGYRLTIQAWENQVDIIPVPGPTALISALVVSGMPTDKFIFAGFLPRKKSRRREVLQELRCERRTTIFYESPHRLLTTLNDIKEILGEEQRLAVCRELTKKHEEKIRGSINEVLAHFNKTPPKGEIVLVCEGNQNTETYADQSIQNEMSVIEHLHNLLDQGFTKKEAIKVVAKEQNLPKKEVYRQAIEIKIE